ncbi:MAG: hypothetical protein WCF54_06140, partial [Terracidiphilus sp.]
AQGPAGPTGPDGATGPAGATGPQGAAGPAGLSTISLICHANCSQYLLETTVGGNPNICGNYGGYGPCEFPLFGVGQEAFVNDANLGNVVIGINMSPGGGASNGGLSTAGQTIQIATTGAALCAFDGQTNAGDFFVVSIYNSGYCHDAGGAYPTSGQVLGIVLAQNTESSFGWPYPVPVLLFGGGNFGHP